MNRSALRDPVPRPAPRVPRAPTAASAAGRGSAGSGAPAAPRLGRYELLGRLGVSDAFLAVAAGPHDFRKLCVVKRLRRGVERGGLLATRMNHPNVPQAYELSDDGGTTFLAMEFLDGQSVARLRQATRAAGVLPDPSFWCRVASDALAGLHHFHELRDYDGSPLDPVHRDIRPEHVIVTYEGRVCLLDFGGARLGTGQRIEGGDVVGEPGYVAPEVAMFGAIDRRADVFAMGVLLWESLAAAAIPVRGSSASEARRPRPRVSAYRRRIDPRLDAIVARALEVDPSARYPTAWAMREALEGFLELSGTAPRPADVGETVAARFAEERARMNRELGARLGGPAGPPRMALVSFLEDEEIGMGTDREDGGGSHVRAVGPAFLAAATHGSTAASMDLLAAAVADEAAVDAGWDASEDDDGNGSGNVSENGSENGHEGAPDEPIPDFRPPYRRPFVWAMSALSLAFFVAVIAGPLLE